MDSVLTYLVDTSIDPVNELKKSIVNLFNTDNVFLFRDLDHSLMTLLSSMKFEVSGEVIISALAPISYYNIIKSLNLIPVVVDVNPETGLILEEDLNRKLSDTTVLIINVYDYCFTKLSDDFNNIKQFNIYRSGIVADSEDNIITGIGAFNIISLEDNALVNSVGGAVITCDLEHCNYISNQIDISPSLTLQGLNASFINPQLGDLNRYFSKQKNLLEIYKTSLLKSGYYTLDLESHTSGNFFPVVVKKSLKEIQKYCRSQGVETLRGYRDSIVKNSDIKAVNAKSLSSRTLLFPISLIMKKDSIELISKILSTLP